MIEELSVQCWDCGYFWGEMKKCPFYDNPEKDKERDCKEFRNVEK